MRNNDTYTIKIALGGAKRFKNGKPMHPWDRIPESALRSAAVTPRTKNLDQ